MATYKGFIDNFTNEIINKLDAYEGRIKQLNDKLNKANKIKNSLLYWLHDGYILSECEECDNYTITDDYEESYCRECFYCDMDAIYLCDDCCPPSLLQNEECLECEYEHENDVIDDFNNERKKVLEEWCEEHLFNQSCKNEFDSDVDSEESIRYHTTLKLWKINA